MISQHYRSYETVQNRPVIPRNDQDRRYEDCRLLQL